MLTACFFCKVKSGAVDRTKAEAKEFHLKNINDASRKTWYASAWYLERKHPERWAKREVPPNDEGPKDEVVVIV